MVSALSNIRLIPDALFLQEDDMRRGNSQIQTLYFTSIENCGTSCFSEPLCYGFYYIPHSTSCDLVTKRTDSNQQSHNSDHSIGYLMFRDKDVEENLALGIHILDFLITHLILF